MTASRSFERERTETLFTLLRQGACSLLEEIRQKHGRPVVVGSTSREMIDVLGNALPFQSDRKPRAA